MVAYDLIWSNCCHRIFKGLSLLLCGTHVDIDSLFLYMALLNLLHVPQGVIEGRLTLPQVLAWAWILFVSTEDRSLSSETVQTRVFDNCCRTKLSRKREFQCEYFSAQLCYIESVSF